MPFFQFLEALGGEEPEAQVAKEAGVVEHVERAAEVAAEEERLREHVDVGGVARGRGHLVREEDGGRVEVLPDAVPRPHPEPRPQAQRRISSGGGERARATPAPTRT